MKLIHGDCLKEMFDIPDNSVDMILTDPPYGTTACKWDSIIPLEPMWEQLKRIIKPNGAICLFGSQLFTSALVMSNPKMFKYEWVWEKSNGTNFMSVKFQPFKIHENILIFSKSPAAFAKSGTMNYFPQMTDGKPYTTISGKKTHTFHGVGKGNLDGHKTDNNGKRYPKSILKVNEERGLHPTQKPVALMEYLIKTYTNEGETVLDFTMGSGTTGVAAKNLNRDFIGIELDEKYFEIAKQRIEGTQYNHQINRTQKDAPVI